MNHIAPGQQTVTASLVVDGARAAHAFYRDAFGAEIGTTLVGGDLVMYSELTIEGTMLTLSDPMPEVGLAAPGPQAPVASSLLLWVPDVDATVARAVELGARLVTEVQDQFHGDRTGVIRDPFGHRWIIGTHQRDMTEAEMQAAMETWMAG